MEKATRIIKKTMPDGRIEYTIQKRHFIFFWLWVDARVNIFIDSNYRDTFATLEDAKKHLCFFNGTKVRKEVIDI